MTVIRIREHTKEGDQWQAQVIFEGGDEYAVPYGRPEVTEYQGRNAFLFLQGELFSLDQCPCPPTLDDIQRWWTNVSF